MPAVAYGGNIGAWAIHGMAAEGCTLKQAAELYVLRCIGSMGDAHRARAKLGLTEEQQAEVDRLYSKLTSRGSFLAEHLWDE